MKGKLGFLISQCILDILHNIGAHTRVREVVHMQVFPVELKQGGQEDTLIDWKLLRKGSQ